MKREELERLWSDPKNWRGGMIYMCPEDPRIVVPKRIRWTGYTINLSRKLAIPFVLASVAFILLPFLFLFSRETLPSVTAVVATLVVLTIVLVLFCHWESTRER